MAASPARTAKARAASAAPPAEVAAGGPSRSPNGAGMSHARRMLPFTPTSRAVATVAAAAAT